MKTRKSFYYILALWLFLVLAFGLWWLYLLYELGSGLTGLTNQGWEYARLIRMLKYEGGTFIFILFAGGLFAGRIYLQDLKKSRAIQAFFSSMTHELKTPLASIKLQAQVIDDMVQRKSSPEKLTTLIKRLLDDSNHLEVQMDKALQLARIEQGGVFHQSPINLSSFFSRNLQHYFERHQVQLNIKKNVTILADEFALELIFKNLFENTKKHQGENQVVIINGETRKNSEFTLTYNDQGTPFKGDPKQLTTLFYKHNSTQGTGVGLYLCKKLTRAMGGEFTLHSNPNLFFRLTFKTQGETL